MLHYHFTLRNGSNPLVGDGVGHAFANDKSGQRFAPMCIAAVLVAIAVLSGGASARSAHAPLFRPRRCCFRRHPCAR